MERAWYIVDFERQKEMIPRDCRRIYWGSEFCERLIPGVEDLRHVLEFCRERDLAFTLMTPFVTDRHLLTLEPLFECLSNYAPGSEVLVGDWGVLRMLLETTYDLKPVLGRLLVKQKRDPRVRSHLSRLPGSFKQYLGELTFHKTFIGYLSASGVKRIEIDNFPQGLTETGNLLYSLHYPYVYLTSGRFCPVALSTLVTPPDNFCIVPCRRECTGMYFRLFRKDCPAEVYQIGNAQLYKNETLMPNLGRLNIDRLVIRPEL